MQGGRAAAAGQLRRSSNSSKRMQGGRVAGAGAAGQPRRGSRGEVQRSRSGSKGVDKEQQFHQTLVDFFEVA